MGAERQDLRVNKEGIGAAWGRATPASLELIHIRICIVQLIAVSGIDPIDNSCPSRGVFAGGADGAVEDGAWGLSARLGRRQAREVLWQLATTLPA
jgi:hypothetical protein